MDKESIRKKAKEILRDHNLLDIPVDPLRVAKALGIKVMNAKFSEGNISGAIARRNTLTSIFLNAEDPPTRKRFSIAHEIGHYALHLKTNEDRDIVDSEDNFRTVFEEREDWSQERRMEWEANFFAAELLMDEDLIKKEWSRNENQQMLALKFQVSQEAMNIRLTTLGLKKDIITDF